MELHNQTEGIIGRSFVYSALGTPTMDEKYRGWFALRDSLDWRARLQWRMVRQESIEIALALCTIMALMAYCLRTEVFCGPAMLAMQIAFFVWMRKAVAPIDNRRSAEQMEAQRLIKAPPLIQFNMRRLLGLMLLCALASIVAKLGLAAHEQRLHTETLTKIDQSTSLEMSTRCDRPLWDYRAFDETSM